ncbi:hypothetical protein BS50DRAFT_134424 [Corynespora cassiicola Philippines]|uniref:Uncharacterized protein n=1 Tax=Corynespora cassiicola Philippines TaxID=1448308 RepID=A0A2T2N928_CORCC|nr:hypothetical protein BS50DRAFT_134424 [Corynespora cassiicola Philippines]
MAIYAPRIHATSPLNAIPPETPPSKSQQWAFLQECLGPITPYSPTPIGPSWLAAIDRSILITLLAKNRSELALLHSEKLAMSHPHHSSAELKLPDYTIGTPSSGSTPTPSTQTPTAFAHHDRNASPTRTPEPRSIEHGIEDALLRLNTAVAMAPLPAPTDDLSPLTPTFGPRRGLVISGTTARRRSSAQFTALPPQDAAQAAELDFSSAYFFAPKARDARPAMEAVEYVPQRRAVWEAEWAQIEGRLEDWADRFAEGVEGSKAELWRELVRLRVEKGEVLGLGEEQIGKLRGMSLFE